MNLTAHDQEVLEQVKLIVDSIKAPPLNSELVELLREQIEFEREIRRHDQDIRRRNSDTEYNRIEGLGKVYAILPDLFDMLQKTYLGPSKRPHGTVTPASELPPLPDGIRRERCTECKCAMLVADGQNKVVCPACLSVFGDDSIASETSAEPTG